jgi:outer membrane protein assembly factor BamB
LDGTRQLLVQTRTTLNGIAEPSGEVLWSRAIKAFRGMNILTPTVYDNQVFTSAHSGTSQLFKPRQTELTWENPVQAYMSSPIVIGDHLYLHLKNERFTCLDLKTGKTAWTTKPQGKYWSLVAQENRILALGDRGTLFLIHAHPESFELVDRRRISKASTWAHLAVAGDMVFVRELNALAAFRWK